MSNGFSDKEMLQMILERVDTLGEKVDRLGSGLSDLNSHGCAHRSSDLERITNLEKFRDKSVLATIGALFVSVSSAIGFIISHTYGHK